MSSEADERTPYEIVEQEKEAYLEDLPGPDSDWPPDVRCIYRKLHDRIFEMGLKAQSVTDACGVGDNNIHIRFDHYTGHGIKELILLHRLELAKRLLRYDRIPIGKIALAVGYENPSGFSATFKRWEGYSPSEWRERQEE